MSGRPLLPVLVASLLLAGCSSEASVSAGTDCVPAVIGHRGSPSVAPEETIASFQKAIDDGARIIEGDVQFTKDGQPVMLHDDTVDRTTDGRGPVARKTLEQVRSLDAGAWKGAQWKGTAVPTLTEFLQLAAAHNVDVIVELKSPKASRAHVITFLNALSKTGMSERSLVESFHPENLKLVRAVNPSIRTGLITSKAVEASLAASLGSAVLPNASVVTAARVKAWHAAGLQVYPWTADTPEQWSKVRTSGADGVMTNRVADYQNWARGECASR